MKMITNAAICYINYSSPFWEHSIQMLLNILREFNCIFYTDSIFRYAKVKANKSRIFAISSCLICLYPATQKYVRLAVDSFYIARYLQTHVMDFNQSFHLGRYSEVLCCACYFSHVCKSMIELLSLFDVISGFHSTTLLYFV